MKRQLPNMYTYPLVCCFILIRQKEKYFCFRRVTFYVANVRHARHLFINLSVHTAFLKKMRCIYDYPGCRCLKKKKRRLHSLHRICTEYSTTKTARRHVRTRAFHSTLDCRAHNLTSSLRPSHV